MKIVFMGTPAAAVVSLEKLIVDGHDIAAVYTQPDRASGRGNKIVFSAVKEFAVLNDLRVFQPSRIKTAEALEEFRSHKADVAIVVAYGRILPEPFLTAFPNGAINVHFSPLPKYRGAAPVNWAIVRGESETGVTTMRMDAGLDTGDILIQRAVVIGESETSIELMSRLSTAGAEVLAETIESLATITPVRQDDMLASYAPIMTREDGLIDWRMPARDILNRIRGFQPFPSSFTYFQQRKLTLWKGLKIEIEASADALPGQILTAAGDVLHIACGDRSVLAVEEIQPEGKRRMNVRDFLNGFKLSEGAVFGA